MLDIDYFKKINDSYGHAGGDVVLTEFAARCKLALRDTDLLGRIGGDEFLVFLPQTSRTEAFQTANRLLEITARTPFSFNGEQIAVTLSIGVATVSQDTKSLKTTINVTDRALYKAKQNGRNTVR